MSSPNRSRQRGYVLVVTMVSALALLGAAGLAVDMGKLYIAKSELQNIADAASVAAALELDGTAAGLTRAKAAAGATGLKWNFNSTTVTAPSVEFANSGAGPWSANPGTAVGYRWARVSVTQNVKMFFLPVITAKLETPVNSRSAAAQVARTTWREGLFPFSPFAHNNTPPYFGLTVGESHTLRWPTSPTLGKKGKASNVCPGDRIQAVIDKAEAGGASERGYIEINSANVIRLTIEEDYQSITRTVGDLVQMTGGAKQSQLDSIEDRIAQDSDTASQTFAQYLASSTGNGRRIVAAPINDGGTPPGSNHRIVGIGGFFLTVGNTYGNGGNQAWCAEFIGTYVQGSHRPGAGDGTNGSFVVRLTE
ncbi:MAG TPA: hypothetical protein DEH78_33230 [Solibacterales bacterium]|nr:hypothetical protein [Bryobacterales bacterium]